MSAVTKIPHPKEEEAVERGNPGLFVANDTILPDNQLPPWKDISALAELEFIHRVRIKAGLEIGLVGTEGAQPSCSTGKEGRAA